MTGPLPSWVVLGAAKSGTTSLAYWLAAHPEVHVAPVKEVHFFDREQVWLQGPEHYRTFFAGAAPGQQAGEATPDYLWRPEVPERMAGLLPEARLVVLLRHPVERMHSHYWHARSWGGDLPEFDELTRLALDGHPRFAHYLERGHYAEQLERFRTAFGSLPLVLLTSELEADPATAFTVVCRHLGISEQVPDIVGSVHNAAHRRRSPRLKQAMDRTRAWEWLPAPLARGLERLNRVPVHYPPVPAAARATLLAHYLSHNARLRTILGRDLPGWDD
jgi:hypothetical protein